MKLVPLLLLGWISSAAAQTFHISPTNPILVGEPLSIQVEGLPADQSVTLTAERAMPELYRSQAVFSAPQGVLDLATAKPLSGTYADADIHGLFWSMAPVEGGELGGLQPLQVRLKATVDGRVLAPATIEFIDALPAVKVEPVEELPGAVFATLPGTARRPALIGASKGAELDGFRTGRDVRMRRFQDKGRAANPAAAVKARIAVEKFRGPLLVIGAHDDQVWASGMMAQNIAERRAAANLETIALISPKRVTRSPAAVGCRRRNTTSGPARSAVRRKRTPPLRRAPFPKRSRFLQRTLRVESDAQR